MLASLWLHAHQKKLWCAAHSSVLLLFSLSSHSVTHSLSLSLFPDRGAGVRCKPCLEFVWPQRVWSTAAPAAWLWLGEWTDVCVFNACKWSGFEVLRCRFDRFSCLLFWCCYDFDRGEMKNTDECKRAATMRFPVAVMETRLALFVFSLLGLFAVWIFSGTAFCF